MTPVYQWSGEPFVSWWSGFADPGDWCERTDRSPWERRTPASWYRRWSWSLEAVCPFRCPPAAAPAPPEDPCWPRPDYSRGRRLCFRSTWQDGRRIIRYWVRCKARSSRACRPSIRPPPQRSDFSVIITRIIRIRRWAIIPWCRRSLGIILVYIICIMLLIMERKRTKRKASRNLTVAQSRRTWN